MKENTLLRLQNSEIQGPEGLANSLPGCQVSCHPVEHLVSDTQKVFYSDFVCALCEIELAT